MPSTINIVTVDHASWSGAPAGASTVWAEAVADMTANLVAPSVSSPVTIRITRGWGVQPTFGGNPGGAQSSWDGFVSTDYATYRNALLAIASKNSYQATAYNSTNLPSTNPFPGSSVTPANVSIQSAWSLYKALGIFANTDFGLTDGTIGFNSSGPWDFSSHGAANPGTWNFYGATMHEMSEVFCGRQCNGADNITGSTDTFYTLDLWSYNATGVRTLDRIPGHTRYVSNDGSIGNKTWDLFQDNGNTNNGDPGDMAQEGSAFDAFLGTGLVVSRGTTPSTSLQAPDWLTLTLPGWGLSTSSGLIAAGLAQPVVESAFSKHRRGITNLQQIHTPGAWQRF